MCAAWSLQVCPEGLNRCSVSKSTDPNPCFSLVWDFPSLVSNPFRALWVHSGVLTCRSHYWTRCFLSALGMLVSPWWSLEELSFLCKMLISLQSPAINTACCGTHNLLGVIGSWRNVIMGQRINSALCSLPTSELSPSQVIFVSLLNLICKCDPPMTQCIKPWLAAQRYWDEAGRSSKLHKLF